MKPRGRLFAGFFLCDNLADMVSVRTAGITQEEWGTDVTLGDEACEKDVLGDGDKGEKVEILFSINTSNYHTAPDLVRSGGVREPDSRTIYLNEDFYLRATLTPDAEEDLLGDEPFIDEQKLCFAAFLTDGTQVGTMAVYTYSNGKWTSSNPLGITPDNITEYRFVAYSYFDETGTPPTDGLGIDPSHDLVWGQSVNKKIEDYTEAVRTVSISMTHKFARIRVRVRSSISSATITTLSGVTVEGGKEADLALFDGGISYGNAVTQGVSIASSGTDIYSSYRTVSPVSPAPIQVKIGTLEVSVSGCKADPFCEVEYLLGWEQIDVRSGWDGWD
jgi:hypothetical protein